jgi:hypothetical protein
MIDLDKMGFDVDCSKCGFSNSIKIKQVRLMDAVICRGCKSTIKLEDHMNETRKAVRSFRNAIRELDNQLRKIGNITINL